MRNIKITVAMALMASTVFASNLSRPQEVVTAQRNHFIDFSTNNSKGEVSYTFGIEVKAIKPTLSTSLGHEAFDSEEENLFIEGRTLGYNTEVLPSISGSLTFSDQNSATLFNITLDHYNKFGLDMPIHSKDSSNIFLNHFFHGKNDPIAYSTVQSTFNNEMTKMRASISGYSIQYKNFSFSSLVGATGNHMLLETSTRATEASSNEILVNTFAGKQTSISAGIYASIRPSLVIYDSEFSSIYLSAELSFTGEVSSNRGNVFHYQTNMETESQTNTSNTLIDEESYTTTSENKLAIALVSKPQESDMSFFTLQFGVGLSKELGRDMISKVQTGTAGDISSSYAFLSLGYTM